MKKEICQHEDCKKLGLEKDHIHQGFPLEDKLIEEFEKEVWGTRNLAFGINGDYLRGASSADQLIGIKRWLRSAFQTLRESVEKERDDYWVELCKAHRNYCTPKGNKNLTQMLGKKNRVGLSERTKVLEEAIEEIDKYAKGYQYEPTISDIKEILEKLKHK